MKTTEHARPPGWAPLAACVLGMAGFGFVAGVAFTLTTPFGQMLHGLSRWVFYLPFSLAGIGAQMVLTCTPLFLLSAAVARRRGVRGWIAHMALGAAAGIATSALMLAISGAGLADILTGLPQAILFTAPTGAGLGALTVGVDKAVARLRASLV